MVKGLKNSICSRGVVVVVVVVAGVAAPHFNGLSPLSGFCIPKELFGVVSFIDEVGEWFGKWTSSSSTSPDLNPFLWAWRRRENVMDMEPPLPPSTYKRRGQWRVLGRGQQQVSLAFLSLRCVPLFFSFENLRLVCCPVSAPRTRPRFPLFVPFNPPPPPLCCPKRYCFLWGFL